MRAADRAEQARIDATLALLDEHLGEANIDPATATLIAKAARKALLLRDDTLPSLGWIVCHHGEPCVPSLDQALHVQTAKGLTAVLSTGSARLAYVVELDPWWLKAAGDRHVLAEVAARMPQSDVTPTGWPQ